MEARPREQVACRTAAAASRPAVAPWPVVVDRAATLWAAVVPILLAQAAKIPRALEAPNPLGRGVMRVLVVRLRLNSVQKVVRTTTRTSFFRTIGDHRIPQTCRCKAMGLSLSTEASGVTMVTARSGLRRSFLETK